MVSWVNMTKISAYGGVEPFPYGLLIFLNLE
jgi:hypothetical protein